MPFLSTLPRAATADRTKILGASAAPIVLGLSPYMSPFEFWLSLRQQQEHGDELQGPKARGRFLEPAIRDWTAAIVGAVEVEGGIPIDQPGIAGPAPWAMFHPDGAMQLADGVWRLFEAKAFRAATELGDDGSDQIPLHVACQVQYQLACCGLAEAIVGVYLPMADRLRTFVVPADVDLQVAILERCDAWVQAHMYGRTEPPVDGSDGARKFLQGRYPEVRGLIRSCTEFEAERVRELAQTKAEIKRLEAIESALANDLRQRIGDDEGLVAPGIGKVTCRAVKGAERIDGDLLRRLHPEAAAECTVRSADRRDLRFWPAKG